MSTPKAAQPATGVRKQFEELAAEAYGGNISHLLLRDPDYPEEYMGADLQAAWRVFEAGEQKRAKVNQELLEALERLLNHNRVKKDWKFARTAIAKVRKP